MSTAAERQRRSRAHKRGDHSLCTNRCSERTGAETILEGDVTDVTSHVTTSRDVTATGHLDRTQNSSSSQTRQREVRALELSAAGWNLDRIAEELGYYDRSAARKAIARALDRQAAASVDSLRQMADAELEELRVRLYQLMELPGTNVDQALKAVNSIVKVQERRAKLHGLDAGAGPAEQQETETAFTNDFSGQKGFFIVLDGAPARHVIPHDKLILNSKPGAGNLQPPTPAIIMDPLLLPGAGTVRKIIGDGGLLLDGVHFSMADEDLTDEFCQEFYQAHKDANAEKNRQLWAERGMTSGN